MGGGPEFECPHCGKYRVSDYLSEGYVLKFDELTRIKLKHLLYEHRLRKGQPLFLGETSGVNLSSRRAILGVSEFLERYPKTPLEYFDRALENLSWHVNHPTGVLSINLPVYAGMFCETQEGEQMVNQLVALGYLNKLEGGGGRHVITPKGWMRIRELNVPGRDSKQAFVAMWFGDEWRPYFDIGIKPAIEEAGYHVVRIDLEEHNEQVMDRVILEIRRSRFVVADLRNHRNGVYFEAGFGFGYGIPTIFTVSNIDKDKAHFDVQGYPHIRYDTPEELRQKLLSRIKATIS